MSENNINIKFYNPSKPQQKALRVLYKDEPFITLLNYGRQTGKSFMSLIDAIERGMNSTMPINIRFVTPVYSLAVKHMNTIDKLFTGREKIKEMIFKKIKYKEQEYHFHNGSVFSFLSADAEDNLRGDTAHFMYIDEAAFIKETTYTEILLPMLTQTGGRILMFSTPNGKNWFYKLYQQGQKKSKKYNPKQLISMRADYRDLKDMPNYDSIYRTIMSMKESMSVNAFNREVLAEFVTDLSLFSGVEEASYNLEWLTNYLKEREETVNGVKVKDQRLFIGIDIGVVDDYTVLTCMTADGVVLEQDRFNLMKEKYNHTQFKDRIKNFVTKYEYTGNLAAAYMEINNKELLYDELVDDDGMYMLYPVKTSTVLKPLMVENLVKMFDRGEIKIPDDDNLHEELYAFKAVQNPATGKWQYRAEQGGHDDMVMSLIIAAWCRKEEMEYGTIDVQ